MCVVKQEELCFVTGLTITTLDLTLPDPYHPLLLQHHQQRTNKSLPQSINQFYPYFSHCQQVSSLVKTDSHFSQNQFSDRLDGMDFGMQQGEARSQNMQRLKHIFPMIKS